MFQPLKIRFLGFAVIAGFNKGFKAVKPF